MAWFAPDALPEELLVTGRREGDRIKTFGGSEVTLKKLFIDQKLTFEERRRQLAVRTPDGKIVWLPNLANSSYGKVPENSPTAILLTFTRR